jgi:hypothetical protein
MTRPFDAVLPTRQEVIDAVDDDFVAEQFDLVEMPNKPQTSQQFLTIARLFIDSLDMVLIEVLTSA